MLQNRIRESLTARIFLITVMILLGAGAITFGFIAWATPSTYTAVVNDELTQQVDALVEQLSSTDVDGAGSLLDAFIQSTGTAAMLVGPDGKVADTGSRLAVQAVYEDDSTVVTVSESDFSNSAAAGTGQTGDAVSVTMSEQATITRYLRVSGQTGTYTLYVTPRMQAENLAVQALIQMAPWLLLVLAAFSLLCALAYSRYITRPIVRISGIAEKMAELDFHWECGEQRRDEIGKLGRSLDRLSQRLSAALHELETANCALRGEVERNASWTGSAWRSSLRLPTS